MGLCDFKDIRTFKTGIVTQLVGPCVGSTQTCSLPDYRVVDGKLDWRDYVTGWVLNQLSMEARADDKLTYDRRGWWYDSFRAEKFVSGSKLWTLRNERSARTVAVTARLYIEQALSYLVTWGVADKVIVTVDVVDSINLSINIQILSPTSQVADVAAKAANLPGMGWVWSF
jgi:phage gp46-like protein